VVSLRLEGNLVVTVIYISQACNCFGDEAPLMQARNQLFYIN